MADEAGVKHTGGKLAEKYPATGLGHIELPVDRLINAWILLLKRSRCKRKILNRGQGASVPDLSTAVDRSSPR